MRIEMNFVCIHIYLMDFRVALMRNGVDHI